MNEDGNIVKAAKGNINGTTIRRSDLIWWKTF
jgi:hypothetical protein